MKLNFRLGADVQCKDKQHGKLAGVVVEPEMRQITNILVKEGLIFTQAHVLPLSLVQSASEETLQLSIESHEIAQHPQYRLTVYEHPVAGYDQAAGGGTFHDLTGGREPVIPMVKEKIREGIATGQVVIEAGMAVNTIDGSIGKVDHVISECVSGKITHLVVHRGLIFADRLVIPISAVEDLDTERLLVADTDEGLNQFAPYSPEIMDQVLAE